MRVLVVDDVAVTAEHVSRLLSIESDVEVVGTALSGQEAIRLAHELHPDIVLMDINMPGLDGIETTERLTRELPSTSTVMMSVQADGDYLQRSMLAGARGFLVKPFNADELAESLRNVFARRVEPKGHIVAVGPGHRPAEQRRPGRVVALFSPKGGAGTTTIAVNLAVAIAQMDRRVALVDADLQFGDAGVFLNLDPTNASITDAIAEMAQGNPEAVDGALLSHRSGLHVLLAPPSPDSAELVSADHMRSILARLVRLHEVVIVDCATVLNEATLAVLDMADEIICPIALDIPAIRSVRVFVDLTERLGYPESKLRLVINRADTNYGIRHEDVQRSVGRKIEHSVISDARAAVHSLNHGVPFVLGNKRAAVSRDVVSIAESLLKEDELPVVTEAPRMRPNRRLALARR
jgi:pilus assembly protein CpaE